MLPLRFSGSGGNFPPACACLIAGCCLNLQDFTILQWFFTHAGTRA
jgi:hypothetical protein